MVGQVLGFPAIAGPLDPFPPEALDLVSGRSPEILVEGFAGIELLAVDEQGARTSERVAVLVEVELLAHPFVG